VGHVADIQEMRNAYRIFVVKSERNSSYSHAIFLLQKKAIRAMLEYGNAVSCRIIFNELGILPLASQYLFSLLLFVSYNKDSFSSNTVVPRYTSAME
jgi:hypothetical protein